MTFLAPGMLALGAAIAVPLVLHLLQRHQGPRLVFPAVRYLRRAEREHATRIRLRQVLLLALRVLAVLLLTLAAARPFVSGAGDAHEPTAVALVLDNSLSSGLVMGDRRVLDRLRAAALETVAAAGPDDALWLIRAGEPWRPALAGRPGTLAAAIEATTPSHGAADLAVEIRRAATVLEGAGPSVREIHLLSDLQAGSVPGVAALPAGLAVLALEPDPVVPMNRAVTSVTVGGGLSPRSRERSTVAVDLRRFPALESDSVDLRLSADGRVRSATRAPSSGATVLPWPAGRIGTAIGHVEVDRDALAADDRRYFVVDVVPPPAVALARRAPFLDEALAVLAEANRIRFDAEAPEVVIAPGAAGVSGLLQGRDAVILPPTSPLELTAANRRLAGAGVPWRFEPPAPGEARIDTTQLALATVLADTRLRQVYGLTAVRTGAVGPVDNARVRVRLRSGAPWAVTGRLPDTDTGGRYVLLATPLTPAAGTLPTSAAMLPLLDRAVNVWARDNRPTGEYEPGDQVPLPAATDSVRGPDGRHASVVGGAGYQAVETGIHRVLQDDGIVAAFAVNPPASESDLRRLTADELGVRIPGVRTADSAGWSDLIYHRRLGREVTVPFLILALAVLLLESGVAAAGRQG